MSTILSLVCILAQAPGAPERHWSFQPLQIAALPEVLDHSWIKSPVDNFVLSRLETAGLSPSSPTGKSTLLRRLTFDLVGLPPTPNEVLAFLDDENPDALERVIDRLLASPAYGERWGRHWLDVVRYGDCNGADESKGFPNAYHFRNYVIDAFNDDLPYDRFVQEHVAGDLLEARHGVPRDSDSLIGTGFLVLGTKLLAERDEQKMSADIVDEQIDTFGRVFLALTLGCARCHDHKFDPIPTADYYALAGIFGSTKTMAKPGQWLERTVHSQEVLEKVREYEKQHGTRAAAINTKLTELSPRLTTILQRGDGSEVEVEAFPRGNLFVDSDEFGKGIGVVRGTDSNGGFAEFDVKIERGGLYLVQFRYAAADVRPARILVNGQVVKKKALIENTGSWFPDGQRWSTEGRFSFEKGPNVVRFDSETAVSHWDKFRIVHVDQAVEFLRVFKEIDRLENEKREIEAKMPKPIRAMAVAEGAVQDKKVHIRGNHLDLGPAVPRRFLQIIAGADQQPLPADQSGRLQLAQWLTSLEHPLTSRVMANRVWRWHFGHGLVTSTENFGTKGEPPSHPGLLDMLSGELIRSGWSLKALHRTILLSSTYQMQWRRDTKAERLDPGNGLRWRFDRRRLEAEAIRDALLLIAGRLDRRIGGAPLEISSYNLSTETLETNRLYYESSTRRTVYLPVLRTNLYNFLTLFDFANPDIPTGDRVTTIVPTQALFLLNNPYIINHARHVGTTLLRGANDDSDRLLDVYLRVFGRPPDQREKTLAVEFLESFSKTADESTSEVERSLAAWTAFCQTLLISNEFLYID